MFLSAILLCTLDGKCGFKSLPMPMPKAACESATQDGVELFKLNPNYVIVEGRCFAWGVAS